MMLLYCGLILGLIKWNNVCILFHINKYFLVYQDIQLIIIIICKMGTTTGKIKSNFTRYSLPILKLTYQPVRYLILREQNPTQESIQFFQQLRNTFEGEIVKSVEQIVNIVDRKQDLSKTFKFRLIVDLSHEHKIQKLEYLKNMLNIYILMPDKVLTQVQKRGKVRYISRNIEICVSFIGQQYTYDLNIRPSSYFRLIRQNSQNSIVNDILLQLSQNSINRFSEMTNYQSLCKVIIQKIYRTKVDFKYPDQNNMLEKFTQNPFYLRIINQIICKCTDISIINYVRLPMMDLFHKISTTYRNKQKNKNMQIVYFDQSSFPVEFENINEGITVESKGFLVTRKSNNNSNKPIEFIIELYPQQQKKCNGYCHLKNDIVIINLFNKFYVKRIQKTKTTTKITLTYPVDILKKQQKINQIKKQNQSKVKQQNQQKSKSILQFDQQQKYQQSNRKQKQNLLLQQKKRFQQKQEQQQILRRRKKQEEQNIMISKQNQEKNYQLSMKQNQDKNLICQTPDQDNFEGKFLLDKDFWILKQLNMVYHHFNASKQVPSVWLYDNKMQLDSYNEKLQSLSQHYTFNQISKLIDHLKQKQQTYHIIITKRISLPDPVMKILSQHSKSFYLINTNQFQKQIISLRYPDVVVCDDIKTIFKRFAQNLKKKTQSLFPLFANTSGDKSRINALRFNLQSLLSIRNIKRAKQDFVQLIKRLYDKSPKVQKFIQDYPLDGQIRKVLEWYTTPSFYPSLINNFLRMSNDLLELAYIRLPFFDLFNTIKRLYKDQKQTSQVKQTYRGGIIREEDLNCLKNNVGKVIEMYGFMSTSIDKAVAQSFAGNILFVIKIYQNKRSEQLDYGYANLKGYSAIVDQQQILFNALNTFKVEKVEKKGNIYQVTLKYGELAQIHYRKSKNMQIQKDEKNYLMNLEYQNNVQHQRHQGRVLYITQKYNDSILYYEKYMDQFEIRNLYSEQTITVYFYIAKNLMKKFKHKEALQYYQKCIAIVEMAPFNIAYITTLYFHICKSLNHLGFHEKALLYSKKLQVMYQNYNDKRYYEKMLSNTAVTHTYLKNYDEALEYYQRIKLQFLGIQFTSTDYFNMGFIYQKKKHYEKALQCYKKGLELNIVTYGQNHFKTATSYNKIGQIFTRYHKYQEAQGFFHKAIKILSVFDEKNLDLIISYRGIGQIYRLKRQFDKAVHYMQKVLNITLKIYGQTNSNSSIAYQALGHAYSQSRNFKKCQELFLKALQIQKLIKHNLPTVYHNLGVIYLKSNHIDKAESYLLKSIEKVQKVYDEIVSTYKFLGFLYFKKKQLEKAKEYLTKSLKFQHQITIQFQQNLSQTYNILGQIYESENDFNQSIMYFQKSLKIYQKLYRPQSIVEQQLIQKLFNKLLILYKSWNQNEKLLAFLQQFLKFKLDKNYQLGPTIDYILLRIQRTQKLILNNY